uniref:Uncharacterized protein n=1 Tax=mine drainage metagenome TaxID=410659 RepID=E6QV35_9ZZZZ
MFPAGEEKLVILEFSMGDPCGQGLSGLLGDLKLDGPLSFLLEHDGAMHDGVTMCDIGNMQSHEVAAPQFAIDGEVEEG